ncbi:sec14 cytosolic factor-like protein isoform X2 [Tanacetum coccineum]
MRHYSGIKGTEIGNEKIVAILEMKDLSYKNVDTQATLDKIVIVTNEEERRRFITEVGKEALPEECGGEAKLVALQDVEVPQVIKC